MTISFLFFFRLSLWRILSISFELLFVIYNGEVKTAKYLLFYLFLILAIQTLASIFGDEQIREGM